MIMLIIAFWLMCGVAQAQQYFIRLDDASGMNTDPMQPQLEAAAKELVLGLPETLRDSFKVFDLGCYLHQSVTNQGYKGFFEEAKAIARAQSKYFLIIGKKCGVDGVFTDFEVDLELPTWGRFACTAQNNNDWKTLMAKAIQLKCVKKAKDSAWQDGYVAAFAEAKLNLSNFMCPAMGDIRGEVEVYLGNGSRSSNQTEITITTVSDYYYRFRFNSDVTQIANVAGVNYKGKDYVILFDLENHSLYNIYLADDEFSGITKNPDNTYVINTLLGKTTLDKAEYTLLSWGKYNQTTHEVKDALFDKNATPHNRGKVFELLDLMNQVPLKVNTSSNENNTNKIVFTFDNDENPCHKKIMTLADVKTMSDECLDFILLKLSSDLKYAKKNKTTFLAWLYSPNIDIGAEKQNFDLLDNKNVYYSFSQQERIDALFYIASYNKNTYFSWVDIPDYLEAKANELLKNTPAEQIKVLLENLEGITPTIKLTDPRIKIDGGFTIIRALDAGIADNNVSGDFLDNNYSHLRTIISKLVSESLDIESKTKDFFVHIKERFVFLDLPKDKMQFYGLKEAVKTEFGVLGSLMFFTKSTIMDVNPVGGEYDIFTRVKDDIQALKPFDLVPDWSDCLIDGFDKCTNVTSIKLVPAYTLHSILTSNIKSKTVVLGLKTGTYGLVIYLSGGTLLATEALTLSGLNTSLLAITSSVGHITMDFNGYNEIESSNALKESINIIDNLMILDLGRFIVVEGLSKVINLPKENPIIANENIGRIKNFIATAEEFIPYMKGKIASNATMSAAQKASLNRAFNQIKAYANFFSKYFGNTLGNAAWAKRLLLHPQLEVLYMERLTNAEKTIFVQYFQYVDNKVLLLFEQDAALLEEWRVLATVAEREAFVGDLNFISKGGKYWTHIDEVLGSYNGFPNATQYDIRVTYQSNRPRVGVAYLDKDNILSFELNIPKRIQRQGLGSTIFKQAIEDYNPSIIKGWWLKKDFYSGAESTNLTIFKQKIIEGLSETEAAFFNPHG